MNSNKIEQIGVDALNMEIDKHSLLDTYIHSKDREPSWDGHIYVFNNENMSVESMIGRVPVQVKGEDVEKFSGKEKKYTVDVADLRNYQKEGIGVIYFVVEIINSSNTKIYYRQLLPLDLNFELKKLKKNQKKRRIKFKELSQEEHSSLYYVCRNFLNDSNHQKGKFILSKEEIEDVKNITFDVVTKKDQLEEYLLNNSVYTYAKIEGEKEVIPFEKIDCLGLEIEVNGFVSAGTQMRYYDKYKILKEKDNYIISIGNSIQIKQKERKINIELKGNLYQRLYDIYFIEELMKTNKINISGTIFFISGLSNCEDIFRDKKIYELLKQIFEKLGIYFDIPIEQLKKKDIDNLNKLINLFKNQKFVNSYIKKTGIYELKINKFVIAFLGYKNETESIIFDLFSDIYDSFYLKQADENGKIYNFCLYSNITEKQLLEYSNIKFDIILKAFESIKMYDAYETVTNEFLLTCINVYDKSKNIKFLDLAESLNRMLLEYERTEVNEINKFQIIRRRRDFTEKEIEELLEIQNNSKNNSTFLAISILLERKKEIEYYKSKIYAEEIDIFKKYPIYNLLDK